MSSHVVMHTFTRPRYPRSPRNSVLLVACGTTAATDSVTTASIVSAVLLGVLRSAQESAQKGKKANKSSADKSVFFFIACGGSTRMQK